jgi:hypothetical protein
MLVYKETITPLHSYGLFEFEKLLYPPNDLSKWDDCIISSSTWENRWCFLQSFYQPELSRNLEFDSCSCAQHSPSQHSYSCSQVFKSNQSSLGLVSFEFGFFLINIIHEHNYASLPSSLLSSFVKE